MLDYTSCNLQRATSASDPQSSDIGDLESDDNSAAELAAQQGQPSTSADQDIVLEPATQQGGEPSTSATEDGDTLSVSETAAQGDHSSNSESAASQQVDQYLMAMHCLKSLESAEFEVGY